MYTGIISIRTRAAGVVIHNDNILLMRRKKEGKDFYVFPGGGIEEGEDKTETVEREFMEETTVAVKHKRLLYEVYLKGEESKDQYYYECEYMSGTPTLGECEERESMEELHQEYEPMWVPVKDLKKYLLYPLEIRDILIDDIKNGYQDSIRKIELSIDKLRQEL